MLKSSTEDDVVFDLDRIQARMNGDSDDGEETDETEEESLDKESKDQNYFPSQESANAMLMANEWACSSGETQDELWIGDSGASSHLIGDESMLYNKKPIKGSVSTASGARMNMLCEGNMDVRIINKKGDAVTGTLHVKVANGMKQKLFSFMQALLAGWKLQGEKKPNGDVEIVLTHPNFRPIYFDRMIKSGSSMLLAARNVAQAPEENGNAVEMKGPMSKARFHQICGHAGTHLMQATAKYYGVELSGTVQKCVSCSLEKIRQKNIPKENENKSKIPGERMYLDISSMRTVSLGG